MDKNILTDEELDLVVKTAEDASKNIENDVRKIKEEVQIDPNAELEVESSDNMDMVIATPDNEESEKKEDIDISYEAALKSDDSLSEEDAIALVSLIKAYKENKSINVYPLLPKIMKDTVEEIARANNMSMTEYNKIAKVVLEEFISNAEFEQEYIDIQKSLDDILDMPSVVDMYSEHMREVMEEKIPEVSEKIKDEDPKTAELLLNVKKSFTNAYTFSYAKEMYENTTRIRKLVRRGNERELALATRTFNARNKDTKFILSNPYELPEVLKLILIEKPNEAKEKCELNKTEVSDNYKRIIDMNITESDIFKLGILLFESCSTLDVNDIVDASYMYYMLKNIITLKLTGEGKTNFAVELINNICDTISFIRNKEIEFYAEHMDESKPRKKSGKKNNK